MSQHEQATDIRPEMRHFLLPLIIGILMIPLLGIGILILLHYRKKWKGLCCHITNDEITLIDQNGQITIPLSDVTSCEVTRSRLQHRLGIGNIVINHTNGESIFPGIEDPEPIAKLIERGALSEQERLKIREELKQAPTPHPSGTLDEKNELVGLWQQGLLSEEDYNRELKKFE